jgi:hypothetical protein
MSLGPRDKICSSPRAVAALSIPKRYDLHRAIVSGKFEDASVANGVSICGLPEPKNMPACGRRFVPEFLKPLRPVADFRAFDGGFDKEVRREGQHDFRIEAQAPADLVKENVAAARETCKAFDAGFG